MFDKTSKRPPDADMSSGDCDRVFDIDVTLARLGGNTELLGKLVHFYFDDSQLLLGQLRQAAVHGDVAQVERTAHTLKSLAANFEALQAARVALRIEESAQAGNLGSAIEHIPELESTFKRLDDALTSYVERSAS